MKGHQPRAHELRKTDLALDALRQRRGRRRRTRLQLQLLLQRLFLGRHRSLPMLPRHLVTITTGVPPGRHVRPRRSRRRTRDIAQLTDVDVVAAVVAVRRQDRRRGTRSETLHLPLQLHARGTVQRRRRLRRRGGGGRRHRRRRRRRGALAQHVVVGIDGQQSRHRRRLRLVVVVVRAGADLRRALRLEPGGYRRGLLILLVGVAGYRRARAHRRRRRYWPGSEQLLDPRLVMHLGRGSRGGRNGCARHTFHRHRSRSSSGRAR